MAVANGMFVFEVVVSSVQSMVESRWLVIKSDFADIFSLELKDPKQMHIVMPEPPPLPPDTGKKKGKKKPKPKKKKGKKGKGKVVPPPPEPLIQSGQSVLFSSSAEFLIQTMIKFPMDLSLWSKEENLTFIGSTAIPWDPKFQVYLDAIANGLDPTPVTIIDDYNIFEEGKAKIMAKLGIQVKLSSLGEKVTAAFRTLSEDPTVKKCLYTGINSKTTSFICTLKTSDEVYEKYSKKVDNNFVVDKTPAKINYADYKNAPGAKLTLPGDADDAYCCLGHADKPPESIYKAPDTCPDIDFISDYVRKIITSCNDNMRMLTPRSAIRPRVKATDIDRLCYCRETAWPEGQFADLFRREAQADPCPVCIHANKKEAGARGALFDIADIRGPCGKPECRIARDMRQYIEKLVEEDDKEININELIGPCGSKSCTIVEKMGQFIRHEGVFQHGKTETGLSTQCACVQIMQDALEAKKSSCDSSCSNECEQTSSEESMCDGAACPFKPKVYNVYYFTVEYDLCNNNGSGSGESTPSSNSNFCYPLNCPGNRIIQNVLQCTMSTCSYMGKDTGTGSSSPGEDHSDKTCADDCPSRKQSEKDMKCTTSSCSRAASTHSTRTQDKIDCHKECPTLKLPKKVLSPTNSAAAGKSGAQGGNTTCLTGPSLPSPDDSDLVLNFEDIQNPCIVKTCDIADTVKDFIADGIEKLKKKRNIEEECYCDCVCTFKLSSKTTYCAVCGGYECMGDDMKNEPEYVKPMPCPVYHKMYDKTFIKTRDPWPEEKKGHDASSTKSSKATSKIDRNDRKQVVNDGTLAKAVTKTIVKKTQKREKSQVKTDKKQVGKFTVNIRDAEKGGGGSSVAETEKKQPIQQKYPYPPVPKNMGWNWTAVDIPGLKPRPLWKPGAVHKLLVRKYRQIREGVDIIAKKKRAMMQRKKKFEMKPMLVVKKVEGEYTVQMEVFKKFSKERLLNQYPYDEKPPLIYTIGKTEEEKRKLQKQRERRERRETRRKSRLLQSTFRDRCQEICLKAYNQSIGLMPLPNPNDPNCPCSTQPTPSLTPIIDSCSCSDEGTISSSDTDGDEWEIQFNPPAALFDAKFKSPPPFVENDSQYTYLDYKVKVLDKQGNQVARYFKGPDGKQQCSDLGGFWDPNKVWQEINKDGYIGPDNRWVPANFTGPDGLLYSTEDGQFIDNSGQTNIIGIDGYIDKDGKWAWYPKSQRMKTKSVRSTHTDASNRGNKTKLPAVAANTRDNVKAKGKPSRQNMQRTQSPPNPNKNVKTTKSQSIKIKVATSKTKTLKGKNPLVMSASMYYNNKQFQSSTNRLRVQAETKNMARYTNMQDGIKSATKTNRASNTPRKKVPLTPKDDSYLGSIDYRSMGKSNSTIRFFDDIYRGH